MALKPCPVVVWDIPPKYMVAEEPLKSFRPRVTVEHDCQTVRCGGVQLENQATKDISDIQGQWLTVFKAQWRPNADMYPHFSVRNYSFRHGAPTDLPLKCRLEIWDMHSRYSRQMVMFWRA